MSFAKVSLFVPVVYFSADMHNAQYTVFQQINVPAEITSPLTFDFTWPYLKYQTDSNQIFSTYCSGIQKLTQLVSLKSDESKSLFCAQCLYSVKYSRSAEVLKGW